MLDFAKAKRREQMLGGRYSQPRFGGNHNASKTHCVNGHELAGANVTLRHRVKDGWAFTERRCNACRAVHKHGRGRT